MKALLLASALLLSVTVRSQVICLDPGHPSENGVGSRGKLLTEVGIAWKAAQRIKVLLAAVGYEVVLTKSSEKQSVRNRSRSERANSARADLLLRLHCDAGSGSGIGVYYPDRQAKVQGILGPSKKVLEQSKRAAELFHAALRKSLGGMHKDRGLMTDRDTAIGARQGALTGSVFSKVPVILVEMAVLTNPKDELFLRSKKSFEALCRAISEGVEAAVPRK